MPKLTLTSTFASTIMVGDSAYLTFPLTPRETKVVEVTEVQLRQLTPGLDKLKAAKWLNYGVDVAGVPAPVAAPTPPKVEVPPAPPAAPPQPPPPPPVAEVVAPPVAEVVAPPVAEVVAPVVDALPTEKAPEAAPAQEPVAPKPGFFERKPRNR